MAKEPVRVREKDPGARSSSFDEVVLGYTEEEALKEASRCLQCKDPVCISGCPVNIDIKLFISQIVRKDYAGAYFTIRQKNNFPSICGRVCPAEYQCRKACVLTKKGSAYASDSAINIHFLERFAGDYGKSNNLAIPSKSDDKLSRCGVAVVGSGPAGIACAGELARNGIKVTIFEALHTSGGVLSYGIPQFRLPRDILSHEIRSIMDLGATMITNCAIGTSRKVKDLLSDGFDAIFLGLGAGTPTFLNIKGESLCNVYSANEFLTRVNLMSAFAFPDHHTPVNIGGSVVVIGGGNTAMDAARAAIRIQNMRGIKPCTTVLYRRTESEMPARRLEIEHAKEEGVIFRMLSQPEEFYGDENYFVKKIRCLQCRLGDPDASGRRKPVAITGSDYELNCDTAIVAVGLSANRLLTSVTPELAIDKYSDIIVSKDSMQTSVEGIYAGGDIVGGEGTVIDAMGMAKKAASSIIKYLLIKKI